MRTKRFLWVMLIPFVAVLVLMDTVWSTFIVERFEEGYIQDKKTELMRFGKLLMLNYQLMYKK